MARRRQIYEGKAKILYEGPEPGTLIQYFKDDATAFNAQKRGTISAYQETSGSGRPQSLLVVVKSGKKGIRASATFKIQAGQVAEDKYVRRSLCKIVGAADG